MLNSIYFLNKILDKGINAKRKNKEGESALQIAVKNKINTDIIKKLIQYGFDPN